ncbi:MAG: hypothetical protein MRK01_15370 [Candidatus Scalindua sp.]|nr:hypothetical protein [Candidatus Scalindua sp.]
MNKMVIGGIILAFFVASGCESKMGTAGLGAIGGAAAGAGGYEYHLQRQMDRIEEDFKDGKIDDKEFGIRKDQIKRDSLIKR